MKFLRMLSMGILLPLSLLCGCVGDSEEITQEDRLTKTEEEIVVAHVRRFILRSKKMKLSEAERQLVQTVPPSLHVHYTGHKSGQLSIRWSLPNYRVLLLQRSGKLLSSDRADWTVRIISDQASGKIPEHFYGAHGEDISLPPQ